MAGGFLANTRLLSTPLPVMTKPAGGGIVDVTLPKVGFLHSLFLRITATVTGTLTNPNALGAASIIDRVRVTLNSGIDLVNMSGAEYVYLYQEMLESEYFLAQSQNTGRNAVTATTFNLDMVIPIAMNLRDPIGLIMLQNEQTTAQLTVSFAQDVSVATGATVTATVTPLMWYFTVPVSFEDYPDLSLLHQTIGDEQSVSGSGDYTYTLPRGNIYVQVAHGLGIGASGTDAFTRVRQRLNQAQFLHDWVPGHMDMLHRYLRGRARPAGGIFFDMLGSSGLGTYGLSRDLINSALVTDLAHVITATGSGTLHTIRRSLVPLA